MSRLSETVFSSPHAAALQALKRKKRYEKQLAQIDGTLSTIEFQREALENANTNTEVLKNMGYAAKAMKAAHDNMYVAPAGGGGTHAQGHAPAGSGCVSHSIICGVCKSLLVLYSKKERENSPTSHLPSRW